MYARRRIVVIAGILIAILAVGLGFALSSPSGRSPGASAAPSAVATRATPATQPARPAPSTSSASRPQYIAGYTAHALQRMCERGVSKAEITGLITSRAAGTWQTDARTWKVTGDGLTVIISSDAKIVTVWKT
ncbi:MAG TPA: hypothetical protein VN969_37195 [Streptosporangiaceae bacterium]|nr:hypothetical protein [Streptosporangiaceae bacterium]